MRIEVVCTPFTKYDDVVSDLESKLELEFEPNFLFVFLTESVWDDHVRIIEYLQRRFPNSKMAGCFVEGYATVDSAWMRGLAIMLVEAEGVEVFWAKGENTTETFERLKERVGTGWDSIVLIFPAFYFPSKFDVLKIGINDRVSYHLKYKRAKTLEDKLRVLEEYSNTLESRYIYPVNKALRTMANETPIIGMNLMPLEARFGTPAIFANYECIGRGAVAVCFKGKVNTIFHDAHPERGNSFEETVEIIKKYYPNVEEVRVIKKRIAIGEINGLTPVKYLEKKVRAYKTMDQKEALDKLEKGKLQTVTPYGLAFISRETFGCSMLGLLPLPVNIYPSIFDLDPFYDRCIFLGEFYKDGVRKFGELFNKKRLKESFDFFVIDYNVIPMFGKNIHKIINIAKEYCTVFLGVISSCPSAYIPSNAQKPYFSEIEKKIFVNVTGTTTMLEIKSLR